MLKIPIIVVKPFHCTSPAKSYHGFLVCDGKGERITGGHNWLLRQKADLNRASVPDLMLIKGIGRGLANEIVRERTQKGSFESWSRVDAVPGIGGRKLERLKKSFRL